MLDQRLSIAPMMDWTDRHCRAFHRMLAPHALLYTEMVTEQAIRFGKRDHLLAYSPAEHPVVLQLGGSDPAHLAEAARIGRAYGYDAVNLNCGCPSDRVQAGRFGACLMAEPELVAGCVAAMRAAVDCPVTVKTRIGLDHEEGFDYLARFVEPVAKAGCETFVIHARKAWLKGFSPRDNREIPPLDYDVPRRLKAEFPRLTVVVNGGIETVGSVVAHLQNVDGVMIGRAAYQTPWFLAELESSLFGGSLPDRIELAMRYRRYIGEQLAAGVRLHAITRHLFGLFAGQRGGRAWRRHLSEAGVAAGAAIDVYDRALDFVRTADLVHAA